LIVVNVSFSGSFCDAGLKKFATVLLVVVVVTFRFVAGGEISRSAVDVRFRVAMILSCCQSEWGKRRV
jgi:hypothetical protein